MISHNVKFHFSKGSQIFIRKGILLFEKHGHYDLGGVITITMLQNSKWVCNNTYILSLSTVVVYANAVLITGDNFVLNPLSVIRCSEKIQIGDDCAFARNVYIADNDSHIVYLNGSRRPYSLPIEIGNRVWVCANSTILKGVIILDDTIIGINTLVNKPLSQNGLIVNERIFKQKKGYTFKY